MKWEQAADWSILVWANLRRSQSQNADCLAHVYL